MIYSKKTDYLKNYIDKIDSLNDQLWYYLFTTDELNKQLTSFSDKAKDNYTIDLFKTNPHSQKIHVKVSSLPNFQKENKNLTFGAYFVTCYEILSLYLKSAFKTLKSINGLTNYDWNSSFEPEKNLTNLLSEENLPSLDINIKDTITYFRLRRNHFTHIIETPNKKLTGFISSTGSTLNAYWKKTASTVHLDFNKSLIRDFTQEEIFKLIMLVRICINEVDSHISNLLDSNSVIKFLIKKEMDGKRIRLNSISVKKYASKIIGRGRLEMGFKFKEIEVEKLLLSHPN